MVYVIRFAYVFSKRITIYSFNSNKKNGEDVSFVFFLN